MKMLAHLGEIAHGLDETRPSMPGMRTGETNALQPRHLVDLREQLGEVARRIIGSVVVVDNLAEQLNLAPPRRDRLADVEQDVCLCPHSLVTTRRRNDAERTVIVA